MVDNLKPIALGSDVKATAISAGNTNTCVLLDNQKVKCWGDGQQGGLGYNNTKTLGDAKNEMGDNLPIVNLGEGLSVVAIGAGHNHTCASLDSGAMKCWGYGSTGQLGQENIETLGDGKDKDFKQSNKNEMGDNLKVVNLGSDVKVKAFALGTEHTCALLTDGTVKCWGANERGQLGLDSGIVYNQGKVDHLGDNKGEMGNALPIVNFGSGVKATAVTAGYLHTCALLDNHKVKCWGSGAGGLLGQGNEDNLGDEGDEDEGDEDEEGEMGDKLPYVDILGSEK